LGVRLAALADLAMSDTSKNFWRDRPILVTGATGLLGSALVPQLLARGADVICLIRDSVPHSILLRTGLIDRVKAVRGDIADQTLLERILGEYEIATVFHLAAQTIVGVANANPISTFESNVAGTWPVLVTRCGNFFGPGDLNWNRLVPGTVRSLVRGNRPVIRSDGNYIRDYIFIEDAAQAYIQAVEQLAQKPELKGHAFNFSTETQLTVIEMVELIAKLLKSDAKPEIRNEARAEIPHQYLSAAKAREMLGWKPAFTIEEGLARTLPWYLDFLTENRET
jgi:nucleoside-diphosphate-sugar epimerase